MRRKLGCAPCRISNPKQLCMIRRAIRMDVLTKLWRRAAKSASIARAPAPPAQWLADSVVAGLLLAGFLSVFGARNARAQSDTRTSIESVKARFRFSADEAGVLVPVTLNDISRPF